MGGSKSKPEAPRVTAGQTAGEVYGAQQQYDLPAQQLAFNRLFDPTSGIGAYTQGLEDIRKNVFSGEQAIREALQGQILQQIQSPTGLTQEQMAAQQGVRDRAQGELVRAQRTRANLGGGLFGGRAARAEEQGVSNLQQAFAVEDIDRQERQRQQTTQNAMGFMAMLFPELGIQATPFASPVPGANTVQTTGAQQRGQDVQFQSQMDANRSAMMSALFQSLGQAAGAAGTASAAASAAGG